MDDELGTVWLGSHAIQRSQWHLASTSLISCARALPHLAANLLRFPPALIELFPVPIALRPVDDGRKLGANVYSGLSSQSLSAGVLIETLGAALGPWRV